MAKFVQYQDIVAAYSDKVAEMFAAGWTVFTPTMGGSQGEEAHIHFLSPDHKVVAAVLLERKSSYGEGYQHKMVITVREQTAEDLRCASLDELLVYGAGFRATFWNDKGVVVYEQIYYGMAQGGSYDDRKCHYTTDATIPAQAEARREYKYRNGLYDHSSRWGNEKLDVKVSAAKLVKFVRAHGGRGYGNCRADEIKAVHKYDRDGQMRYLIDFNGAKKQLAF